MSKGPVYGVGIVLTLVGLIIFLLNGNATGPEAYEALYWAFGGCLTFVTGVVLILATWFWKRQQHAQVEVQLGDDDLPPPVNAGRD